MITDTSTLVSDYCSVSMVLEKSRSRSSGHLASVAVLSRMRSSNEGWATEEFKLGKVLGFKRIPEAGF